MLSPPKKPGKHGNEGGGERGNKNVWEGLVRVLIGEVRVDTATLSLRKQIYDHNAQLSCTWHSIQYTRSVPYTAVTRWHCGEESMGLQS